MGKVNRPVWKQTVIDLLLKRDKYVCAICGDMMHKGELFEIHHLIPKSKGGDDSMTNLAAVHLICHKMKHRQNQGQVVKIGPKRPLGSLREMVEQTEVAAITGWLDRTEWNVTRTAQALKIARPTLYEKMEKYGIKR